MHELAICQAIIGEVSSIAVARSAISVSDIHVRVGPLSGVEIPLLRNAFPIAAAGTIAAAAALHLTDSPLRVRCSDCGAETPALANRLICGACSSWRTYVTSGDELLLERIEMQRERSADRWRH